MARQFVAASSQYLSSASAVVTTFPVTFGCWFYPDSVATQQCLMILQEGNTTNNFWALDFRGDFAGDTLIANTYDGVDFNYAETTTGATVSTWAHGCAVFASATSRAVYINGGSKGNGDGVTDVVPVGIDRTRVGGLSAGTGTMDGRIADAAIWNVALTDAEVASLGKGISALLVRPQSLVAYWPLIGRTSPEIDVRGGLGLTLNNGPTAADHPRIIMPRTRQSPRVPAAASSFQSAWAINSNVMIQSGARTA